MNDFIFLNDLFGGIAEVRNIYSACMVRYCSNSVTCIVFGGNVITLFLIFSHMKIKFSFIRLIVFSYT